MRDNCTYEASYESGATPDGTRIDRPETPEWTAVGEDARQLIGQSIADNTRLAYAAALNRLGRRGSGRPPDRFHDCRSHRRVARRRGRARLDRAGSGGGPVPRQNRRDPVPGRGSRAPDIGRDPQGRPGTGTGAGPGGHLRSGHPDAGVAAQPRRRGRGMESPDVATRRGAEDAALVGLAFQAGLRRSEIAALRWADIQPSGIEGAVLVHVRTSKTDPTGDRTDIRMAKNGTADALDAIRPGAGVAGPCSV